MKLLCPKCKAKKNIGKASRFLIFACDGCGFRFRGIHANPANPFLARVSQVLTNVGPKVPPGPITPCPYCGEMVPIEIVAPPGVTSPCACPYCGTGIDVAPAERLTRPAQAPQPVKGNIELLPDHSNWDDWLKEQLRICSQEMKKVQPK